MKYIVHSTNSQTEGTKPVLRVEADGLDATPSSVLPYDPKDDGQVTLASRLLESVSQHPEYNTLRHIAVSFGGLTDESGKEF